MKRSFGISSAAVGLSLVAVAALGVAGYRAMTGNCLWNAMCGEESTEAVVATGEATHTAAMIEGDGASCCPSQSGHGEMNAMVDPHGQGACTMSADKSQTCPYTGKNMVATVEGKTDACGSTCDSKTTCPMTGENAVANVEGKAADCCPDKDACCPDADKCANVNANVEGKTKDCGSTCADKSANVNANIEGKAKDCASTCADKSASVNANVEGKAKDCASACEDKTACAEKCENEEGCCGKCSETVAGEKTTTEKTTG